MIKQAGAKTAKLPNFVIAAALFCGASLHAQVTATVTDLGGQAWFNGTWNVQLVPSPGSGANPNGPFYLAGTITPVPNQMQSGSLSGTGTLSVNLTPNAGVAPGNTMWRFQVCPQASSPCFVNTFTITSANQVVTAFLVPPAIAINAFSTPPGPILAYSDSEIASAPLGLSYWNVTQAAYHVCSVLTAGVCTWIVGASGANCLPGVVCVDGAMFAQTAAGIRSAIVAAGGAGTVVLSAGNYPFHSTDSCILIDKPMDLGGNMLHGGVQIVVDANVGAAQDIFCVTPSIDGEGIRVHDFEILPVSGTPARYAFHLNGAGPTIQHFSMERVEVLQLGSNAVFAEAVGNSNGSPVVSDFNHNVLYGGMVFQNAGDTVRIKDNHLSGTGKLDFAFAAGSSTLEIEGNNITVNGGIHIAGISNSSGVGCIIADNEIETFATFTGSNGALIDLDGITGSHNTDCIIGPRNNIQVVNGITADGIRANFADRTQIYGNRFGRGATTSHDITVTANATDTFVGTNTWVNGLPFSSMLNDSGTRTVLATEFNNSLLINNNKNLSWIDDAGNQQKVLNTDNTGTVNYYGYHGQAVIGGNSNVNYMFDGTLAANIAGAFSPNPSATGMTSGLTTGFIAAKGAAATLSGTGACATFSGQVGGAWAGQATCTGTTAASTFVITTGKTAQNGWKCEAFDQTTRANLLQQTATTTTACTLTATSITQNDVIVFSAIAF